jgi:pimeloyl-ACP methyl ester carboxylesterase
VPARLAIEATGAGERLVMLHGVATDRRVWDLVAPRLAEHRRVVTVDVPGFGDSEPVDEQFELGAVAERIARGLAGHGIRAPYDLVGHSLGGGVALTLACARPRLVRRLILVAPAGLQPMPQPLSGLLAFGADALLAVRREAAPLAELRWGRRLLLLGAAADGARVPAATARRLVAASASARRTAPALQTITASNLRPLLEQLPAPIGVIWGQADRTLPVKRLSAITEVRPDARVVELRDAGHLPMVERPDAFTAALEGLLDSMPALLKDDTTPFREPSTVL